jgi:hypothetical protein
MPNKMHERMYNVVRFMNNGNGLNKRKDYLLKKNEVIKMGRVKLRVSAVYIQEKVKTRERRIKRRKERVEEE